MESVVRRHPRESEDRNEDSRFRGNDVKTRVDRVLDCYGLVCPMPVRKTAQALEQLAPGQVLQVIATDEWFGPDLEAWLRHQPHKLLTLEQVGHETHAYLRRGRLQPAGNPLQ